MVGKTKNRNETKQEGSCLSLICFHFEKHKNFKDGKSADHDIRVSLDTCIVRFPQPIWFRTSSCQFVRFYTVIKGSRSHGSPSSFFPFFASEEVVMAANIGVEVGEPQTLLWSQLEFQQPFLVKRKNTGAGRPLRNTFVQFSFRLVKT